jgi:hypothetical protein
MFGIFKVLRKKKEVKMIHPIVAISYPDVESLISVHMANFRAVVKVRQEIVQYLTYSGGKDMLEKFDATTRYPVYAQLYVSRCYCVKSLVDFLNQLDVDQD